MKVIIILMTLFSSVVFAQEIITKHKFQNIQYVEDVEWYGDEIYCSGYTFNTKINDGNATDAYLIRYDKNLSPLFLKFLLHRLLNHQQGLFHLKF